MAQDSYAEFVPTPDGYRVRQTDIETGRVRESVSVYQSSRDALRAHTRHEVEWGEWELTE